METVVETQEIGHDWAGERPFQTGRFKYTKLEDDLDSWCSCVNCVDDVCLAASFDLKLYRSCNSVIWRVKREQGGHKRKGKRAREISSEGSIHVPRSFQKFGRCSAASVCVCKHPIFGGTLIRTAFIGRISLLTRATLCTQNITSAPLYSTSEMDSSYRPQSPDLSSYAPRSPDLSGLQPQSPDLTGALPSPRFSHHHSHSRDRFGGAFGNTNFGYGGSPTSVPIQPQYSQPQQYDMAPSRRFKNEYDDDDYLPDAPPKRSRRAQHQNLPSLTAANGPSFDDHHSQLTGPLQGMSTQPSDPTLGVQLKTSFPVARIKRIMQADEDIGKVAQVTPHIVSRALELFMIKLISASAAQARGPQPAGGGGGKGPKRVLAQHMKKAIQADSTFDFLVDIINKVPDAPSKGKKDAGSESEDGGSGSAKVVKKRGKKRKDSGDDF